MDKRELERYEESALNNIKISDLKCWSNNTPISSEQRFQHKIPGNAMFSVVIKTGPDGLLNSETAYFKLDQSKFVLAKNDMDIRFHRDLTLKEGIDLIKENACYERGL